MNKKQGIPLILSIILLFSLIPSSLFAQEELDPGYQVKIVNRVFFGANIGAMKLNFMHDIDSDVSFSFSVGANFTYLLYDSFFIAAEVNYAQIKYENVLDINSLRMNISADYLSVPVIFGGQYIFDDIVGLYVGVGVDMNVLISAMADWPGVDTLSKMDYSGQMSRFQPDLIPVLGINIFMDVGSFNISFRYNYPLINSIHSVETLSRDPFTSNFSIYLGYQYEFDLYDREELFKEWAIEQREKLLEQSRMPFIQVTKAYYAPDGTPNGSNLGFLIADINPEKLVRYEIYILDKDRNVFHTIKGENPDGKVQWDGINNEGKYVSSFSQYTVVATIFYNDDTQIALGREETISFQTGPVLQVLEKDTLFKIRIEDFNFSYEGEIPALNSEARKKLQETYETLKKYSEFNIVVSVLLESITPESTSKSNAKAQVLKAYLSLLGVEFRDVESAGFITNEVKSTNQTSDIIDIFIFPSF